MKKTKRSDLTELEAIRNLLILSMVKSGSTSDEIAAATGMGSSTIRKMFPVKKIKNKPKGGRK